MMMMMMMMMAMMFVFTLLSSSVVLTTVSAFVPSTPLLPSRQTKTAGSTRIFGSLPYLEDDNYATILKHNNNNNNSNKKAAILVDVCATWCGPCRLIEPFVEHCAEKFSSDLDVFKFDVASENAKQVKLELLLQGVMPKALPSLILFDAHQGKAIATHTGVLKQEQLEAFLECHLSKIKQVSSTTTMAQAAVSKAIDNAVSSISKKQAGLIGFATMERDEYALGMP
jgi:thioredoxin 1